jgi:hypothetical protein
VVIVRVIEEVIGLCRPAIQYKAPSYGSAMSLHKLSSIWNFGHAIAI